MVNLKNEAKKILLKLDSIDLTNEDEILFWIYSNKEYASIMDDRMISRYIFDKIKEKHFKNNYDLNENINNVGYLTDNSPNIKKVFISLLMYYLDKGEMSDSLIFGINNYVETHLKEKANDLMIKKLSDKVNSSVTVSGIKNDEFYVETGVINRIKDDNTLIFNDEKVDFNSVIKIVDNTTGFELYHNGHVRNFTKKDKYAIMNTEKDELVGIKSI